MDKLLEQKVGHAALDVLHGGTVARVETDSHGPLYEVLVRKPDGTEVMVKVDDDLDVTSFEEILPRAPESLPA